jgi:6-phosphogluconolactonase
MPLASGFVAWLIGLAGSVVAFRRARRLIGQSRWPLALGCLAVAVVFGAMAIRNLPQAELRAAEQQGLASIGEAKGIHPGRVVWVHDPDATDWEGPGHGHPWQDGHTDPSACDQMMSKAIRALTGEATDAGAWDALFRYHNKTHGKGEVGYKVGQKITIKVNLVGFIRTHGGVNPQTYNLDSLRDYMNTSPQMIASLLKQLTQTVGARPSDIAVGDGLAYFANEYYDMIHKQFPDVTYLDCKGGSGRTPWELSTVPLYWSSRPQGVKQDYVPKAFAAAEYLINFANLKAHTGAGVTLCAKNHYGSLRRLPPEQGYYDLHKSGFNRGIGQYRNLVDLMGHAQIGGKTLLYLLDGLYSGVHPRDEAPKKWASAPFNGDWTSSLFASQDPVAIDSVGVDFLQVDLKEVACLPGTDDYLHEAALASNPPSGTFYDPDHAGDTVRLASLGVHEHWNNPNDKQYSRNLGKDRGIELVQVRADTAGPLRTAQDTLVYVGTYTGKQGEGIYVCRLDPSTGALTIISKAAGLENPSFLALDPKGRCVYAVREYSASADRQAGAIVALSWDRTTGGLTFLNEQPSGGQGPCYVTVDRSARFLLTANYGSGSVAVLPIADDGRLQPPSSVVQHQGSSVNPTRQKEPHAHCIVLDPANRCALAADLGIDKIMVYRFDGEGGKLLPHDPPSVQCEPGSGPRHLAFHPDGRHAYVIEELSSTITAFAWDAGSGRLTPVQRVRTLPEGFQGANACAEIQVHPSGRLLYGSNRGHNSIVSFAVDDRTGELRLGGHEPTQGKNPRHFAVDPSGRFLLAANQDSGTVVSFRINQDTGALVPTGHLLNVPTPVCLKMAVIP